MKIEHFQETKEKIEIEGDLSRDEGRCLKCKVKLIKNKDKKMLSDGAITFQFMKLKCPRCKRKYLNLEEAKKYDVYLKWKKNEKHPISHKNHGKESSVFHNKI